jgi:hypothetical protein
VINAARERIKLKAIILEFMLVIGY